MTIEEAIRVNEVLKKAPVLKDDPTVLQALDLNIEALKRVVDARGDAPLFADTPLPGETEE